MDIIDKCVGLFIVAALVPTAISTLQDANTSGWSTTTITLWGLLSILVIVGLYRWVTS